MDATAGPSSRLSPTAILLISAALLLIVSIPAAVAENVTLGANLRWGPFRPNHYFGVRPTVANTMLMGLMWSNATFDIDRLNAQMRAEFDTSQGAFQYGWQSYDARVGGTQAFQDYANGLNLTTQFIKFPYPSQGGGHWGVRVSGTPDSNSRQKTIIVWHLAMQNMGQANGKDLLCGSQYGRLVCSGQHPDLGKFHMKVSILDGNRLAEQPKVWSGDISEDKIWQAKSVYIDKLNRTWRDNDPEEYGYDGPGDGNLHFLQYVFVGSFSFDIMYTSTSYQVAMNTSLMTAGIIQSAPVFEQNFQEVFPITSPFTDAEHAPFGRFLLSNLLAGLGYFHGSLEFSTSGSKDETSLTPAIVETGPESSLLTHTPSRKYLPDGYLWHEGFHLLLVQEWDLDLAIDVLRSWLANMNEDGWIANHQVLGDEVAAYLSDEDIVQEIDVATPPTLLAVALPKIIKKLSGEEQYRGHYSQYILTGKKVLQDMYPALKKHFMWFRDNQQGDMTNYTPQGDDDDDDEEEEEEEDNDSSLVQGYRWRGCDENGCTASGLGDYPRPQPENEEDALHVDTLSWMGASAQAMLELANFTGHEEDMKNYTQDVQTVWETLGTIHWDEEAGLWCDTTSNSSGWWRECHAGYVSIMPLLLGLVDPDSDRLPRILDAIDEDTGELWSDYGLRSLSESDPAYGTGSDTWRGRVWMNMNVLASLRLKEMSESPGDNRQRAVTIGLALREASIATVYRRWKDGRKQEVWESYSDQNGAGGTIEMFTGWTSTVLLLMGMVRDDAGVVQESADDETAGADVAGGDDADASAGDDGGFKFELSYLFLSLGIVGVLLMSKSRIRAVWRKVMGYDRRDREGGFGNGNMVNAVLPGPSSPGTPPPWQFGRGGGGAGVWYGGGTSVGRGGYGAWRGGGRRSSWGAGDDAVADDGGSAVMTASGARDGGAGIGAMPNGHAASPRTVASAMGGGDEGGNVFQRNAYQRGNSWAQ